jgi:glucose-6-phosphate-specific signal transduction histidine kinase
MTGLQDRVEEVGGSMTLDSTPGAGTVLIVLLPRHRRRSLIHVHTRLPVPAAYR